MFLHNALATLVLTAPLAAAREVFAHYMAQTLDSDHAVTDVDTAISMGLTGFAINVGSPSEDYSITCVENLFNAAAGKEFSLFISMDLSSDSDAYDFTDLINTYIGNSHWYTGPNGYPFLSTFSAGGTDPDYWPSFMATLNSDVYFLPCFDDADDYWSDISTFMSNWESVVDGVFSWETAWPNVEDYAANVSTSTDVTIQTAAAAYDKTYMIPLSSLQYKHWEGYNWYRAGEVNLPQRMTEILAMDPLPDFVEVLTWNDAGESHYIGTLWSEGLTDDILAYSNETSWPHEGWQPLVTSFTTAYRYGLTASGMRPPNGTDMIGTMWYRTIMADATCADDPYGPPDGAGAGKDAVNWAIVLEDGITDATAQVWSGGVLIGKKALSAGLNYDSTPGMNTGIQYVEVVDADYNILMSAQGAINVQDDTTGICNFNYQVAQLS
ncbi:putative glucan endo-1,3-alpha-glucosidase agn1 precursor [Xylariales sp. PMI_506]|nr:putative glucan endo-1,3-alpha-glucosidase agn1 precursor [Xylariales sp. PMI_506]